MMTVQEMVFQGGLSAWCGVDGEPGLSGETALGTSLSYIPLVLSKNDKNDNCEAFSCCKLEFTRSGFRRKEQEAESRRGEEARAVPEGCAVGQQQ